MTAALTGGGSGAPYTLCFIVAAAVFVAVAVLWSACVAAGDSDDRENQR